MLLSKHRRYAALRMGGFRAYNGNAAWAVLDRFLERLLRRHFVAKLGVDFLWHGELALLATARTHRERRKSRNGARLTRIPLLSILYVCVWHVCANVQ